MPLGAVYPLSWANGSWSPVTPVTCVHRSRQSDEAAADLVWLAGCCWCRNAYFLHAWAKHL